MVIAASMAAQYVARAVLGGAAGHVVVLGGHLLNTVVSAFGAVLSGVVYYQLRVAKEGVDIETVARVFD